MVPKVPWMNYRMKNVQLDKKFSLRTTLMGENKEKTSLVLGNLTLRRENFASLPLILA